MNIRIEPEGVREPAPPHNGGHSSAPPLPLPEECEVTAAPPRRITSRISSYPARPQS